MTHAFFGRYTAINRRTIWIWSQIGHNNDRGSVALRCLGSLTCPKVAVRSEGRAAHVLDDPRWLTATINVLRTIPCSTYLTKSDLRHVTCGTSRCEPPREEPQIYPSISYLEPMATGVEKKLDKVFLLAEHAANLPVASTPQTQHIHTSYGKRSKSESR